MKNLTSYLALFGSIFSLTSNSYASENQCEINSRHSNGNKALEICVDDRNEDGIYETEIKRRFTPSGTLRVIEYDYNSDGTPERTSEWRYTVIDGKELRHVWYEDRNGDGTIDKVMRWSYSFDGRVLRRTIDNNNDGTIDEVLDFFYDGECRIVNKTRDGVEVAPN